MLSKDTLRQRKEQGLCRDCGEASRPGLLFCQPCADKANARRRQLRVEKLAQGRCPTCRSAAVARGRQACQECLDRACAAGKAYFRRKKAQGLCGCCGSAPADSGTVFCAACREKNAVKAKDRYRRVKSEGTCTRCQKSRASNGWTQCAPCRTLSSVENKWLARRYRDQVLTHYGNRCQCCGEDYRPFLTIDHVNNDGARHRRELGYRKIDTWLVLNNFPPGFQVLCANCNTAKANFSTDGTCPCKGRRAADPPPPPAPPNP